MRASQILVNICVVLLGLAKAEQSCQNGSSPVVSLVQFEKSTVLNSRENKCRTLGRPCTVRSAAAREFEEEGSPSAVDSCCSGFCHEGICEDPDYALFKCTWTEKGVLYAESEWCGITVGGEPQWQVNPAVNPLLRPAFNPAENEKTENFKKKEKANSEAEKAQKKANSEEEHGKKMEAGAKESEGKDARRMAIMMAKMDNPDTVFIEPPEIDIDFQRKQDFEWACPRTGDPVTDFDAYLLGNLGNNQPELWSDLGEDTPNGLDLTNGDFQTWYNMKQSGQTTSFMDYTDCGVYVLQCTWTLEGLAMYDQKCDSDVLPDEDAIEFNLAVAFSADSIPDGDSLGLCYFAPKNVGDPATYQQLGTKDDKWYKLAEYGFLNCVTPQQSFAAKNRAKIEAKRVQCGNLPYNCKTKTQAEDACRHWARDNTALGSGEGTLCNKYELGDTVGRNCNPMWTADSFENKDEIEGCFESDGNWQEVQNKLPRQNYTVNGINYVSIKLDKPLARNYGGSLCDGNLGDVICYKAPGDNSMDIMTKYYQGGERKELEDGMAFVAERSYGFDAACCKGHLPNPFRREHEWPLWKTLGATR